MIEDSSRRIPKRKGKWFGLLLIPIVLVVFFLPILYPSKFSTVMFDYFFLAAMVIFLGFGIYNNTLYHKAWRELAERAGLQSADARTGLFSRAPKLTGTYQGFPVTYQTITRGAGRSRKHYLQLMVSLNQPSGAALQITKQSIFSKAGNLINPESDSTSMYDEINRLFAIKGEGKPVFERALAYASLRQGFAELHGTAFSLKLNINSMELFYEERGQINDPKYLLAVLELMVELARVISR